MDIKLIRLESSVNNDVSSESRGEIIYNLNNKKITMVKITKQDDNDKFLIKKIYFNGF